MVEREGQHYTDMENAVQAQIDKITQQLCGIAETKANLATKLPVYQTEVRQNLKETVMDKLNEIEE